MRDKAQVPMQVHCHRCFKKRHPSICCSVCTSQKRQFCPNRQLVIGGCHYYNCQDQSTNKTPQVAGIQTKLLNVESDLMPGEVVVFDKVVNHLNEGIFYNRQTGEFTLTEAGNYVVNWSVTVEGSDESPFVSFAVRVDDEVEDFDTIPVSVGHLTGSCLITITKGSAKLTLVNHTEDIIQFSRYSPCANLMLYQL